MSSPQNRHNTKEPRGEKGAPLSMMFVLFMCVVVVTDSERLLDRVLSSIAEGYSFLVSYRNSVEFTDEHRRLAKLMHRVEELAQELEALVSS